jgi:2-amino-4-hydroxy-6-hydroxymethyldihydropteridine diphosphokinase
MATERPSQVAYIGIGANLGGPEGQVRRAIMELGQVPASRLLGASSLYQTRPLGPAGQPDYVNAVAALETWLAPEDLLAGLQAIEAAHGRKRNGVRWGARTLDLDLLLFGMAVLDTPGLRVPHPELARRPFVLVPLSDLAPADLLIPGAGLLGDLLAACPRDGVHPLLSTRAPRDGAPAPRPC